MMTRGPAANFVIFSNRVIVIGFGMFWVFGGFKITYDVISSPEEPLAKHLFLIGFTYFFQVGLGMLILTCIYLPKVFPKYEL